MPARTAAAAIGALAFGVVAQYLFVRERIGINVLIADVLLLALAWRLRDRGRPLAPRDAWLPVASLAFASLCAIRADAALLAFDSLAALGLAAGSVAVLRGTRVTDLPLVALLAEALDLLAALAVHAVEIWARALPVFRGLVPAKASRAGRYAGGVALSVPFLAVFAALFSSADAVFARTLTDVFDLARLRDVFADAPARVVVLCAVAWATSGGVAYLWSEPRAGARGTEPRVIDADAATAMVVAIDVLFALFVVIQLAYLFGGRDTVAAAGISYSAYARRGFTELLAVAMMVAGILFTVDLAVRRRTTAFRTAALLLIALGAVVLASAAMRMDLYQAAYGWTELRFYACVAIAYLALALAVLAWAIASGHMAVALQRLVIACVVVALAANAVGPSGLVARADIERFTSIDAAAVESRRDIDLAYLVSLGDGALPTIVEWLPAMPPPERSALERLLQDAARRRAPAGGWQSWNLERARAEELLAR